ncbi:MAG TPA: hypothetical protein VLE69_00415 [Candidatus Saccharimonadales bacterium]|nr:hypothetical protein [Candidatus Saccharimonadales bacterium]
MDNRPENIGEEDPRTQLADTFREFMVLALRQQDIVDAERDQDADEREPVESRTVRLPAGYLYKLDGDYLKILLAEPADDEVLDENGSGTPKNTSPLPPIWVSIQLPEDYSRAHPEPETEDPEERAEDLEVIIFSAENIYIKRILPDHTVERRIVGDNQYIPETMDAVSVKELLVLTAPDEQQQVHEATTLLRDMPRYDLRTIRNSMSESEVA